MSSQDSIAGIRIPIPETVTWAGAFVGRPDFYVVLGTENGRIWFLSENGDVAGGAQFAESGEAINGIALADDLMAVSTRCEVIVHKIGRSEQASAVYRYDGGAHGVISTAGGRFIAPLGPSGILVVGGKADQLYHKELYLKSGELYFYRVVSLGTSDRGDDLIVAACRHSGIVTISLGHGETVSVLAVFRPRVDMDVVDACAIGNANHPRAIASLGSDGSVHLCSDPVRPEAPVTLRFPQICGTGYDVRSAGGHLFVLTSAELYLIPHLANQFLKGERIDGLSTVRRIEADAFDIAVAHEKWLLPLQPGSVSLIPLAELCLDERGDLPQRPAYNVQTWEARPTFNLETALV
jgi:hypothetical protein